MIIRGRLWIAMLAILLLWAPSAAASAPPRVPQGFLGISLDVPVFPDPAPGLDLARQLDLMVASGVENLRIEFDWAGAQPYRSWRDVPAEEHADFVDVGGIPTRFAPLDWVVALAAERGLPIEPYVLDAPPWAGERQGDTLVAIPTAAAPYARFVGALVRRYGPAGSFWRQNRGLPKLPIRMWQVWNEPNLVLFWWQQPFERRYVALLRAARTAIKQADPRAKVVLAGLPNYSWQDLSQIYGIPGARGLFDVVAVHPYTRQPGGVITILDLVRRVMDGSGDRRKPLIADEMGWPSSAGTSATGEGSDFATTESGQAHDVSALLPMLARNRARLKLLGFDYYTWAGEEQPGGTAFHYAGLFRFDQGKFVAKPAFYAFRQQARSLEQCHAKGSLATYCLQ